MQGWIKLHRQLAENPLWLSEPFTRAQAWVDLLILANHKDNFFYVRGNKIDVKRGQIGMAEEAFAVRWRWSRGKVRRYLNDLEKSQQIVQQKSKVKSLIIIVNYEKYQGCGTTDSTTDSTTDGQQTVQQTDTNKNVKKEKNVKNDNNYFTQFWEQYPIKRGKQEATKAYEKAIKKISHEKIMDALETYKNYLQENPNTKIKYAQGWLNSERWDDEYEKDTRIQNTFTKNKEIAIKLHERSVIALKRYNLLGCEDFKVLQDASVFFELINQGFTEEQILNEVKIILNNPPPNGITGWGILMTRFKAY